ncbi:MAG: cytochrome c biogenesis protein/redoxin [Alphaproteobacteria bacterium]
MIFGKLTLAFIEGVLLITSPCIYPILPLLLASSSTGERYRPFAIMAGFFISFTAFVFLARHLVKTFGIMPNTIEYISLSILIFFGAVLVSDKMSAKFSQLTSGLSKWGARILHHAENSRHHDITIGLSIGATIGLVWTPCAGPFMAAIFAQVMRQTDDLTAIILVASFAFGVAIPFLIISLFGRYAMKYFNWLPNNNKIARKIFGIIIILSSLLIATDAYPATKNRTMQNSGYPLSFHAPEFVGIEKWFNTDKPLTMSDLRGKVVLINFWTFSCYNCRNALPAVSQWDKKYRSQGLVVIGVQSPEFASDRSITAIKRAIARHNLRYPIAVDNGLNMWYAYYNKCWPAFYLINRKGNVVKSICGEHNYASTNDDIISLLKEK